jgi:hypothetical protein
MIRLLWPVLSICLLAACNNKQPQGTSFAADSVNREQADTFLAKELTIPTDTLLDDGRYLVLGKGTGKVYVADEKRINPDTANVLGWYDGEVIFGDQTIDHHHVRVYRRYKQAAAFSDYPATLYTGKPADPDFTTNRDARQFMTRIKEACAEGINFAGKYTMVTWGCGSPCQGMALVDRETGRIRTGYGSSLGIGFRKNSRLIIVNNGAIDTLTGLIEPCAYCDVHQQVWTGSHFKELAW